MKQLPLKTKTGRQLKNQQTGTPNSDDRKPGNDRSAVFTNWIKLSIQVIVFLKLILEIIFDK
jgi:hypothetical protein